MEKDDRSERAEETPEEDETKGRRDFLRGMAKWSAAVIGGVLLTPLLPGANAAGWINNRGGGGTWANRAGGGGGWVNRRGGGGSWVNR